MIDTAKKFLLSIGLKKKLIITMAGVTLLLGTMIATFVWYNQTKALSGELRKEGEIITRSLSVNALELILIDDIVSLQRLINETKRMNKDIYYIYILDKSGYALVHTFQSGIPASLKKVNKLMPGVNLSTSLIDTEKGIMRDIAVPITGVAIAHVGMSENRVRETVAQMTKALIIMTLVVMLIGLFLVSFTTAFELKPLDKLMKGAAEIGSGNLDLKIEVNSRGELGALANEFNKMADDLKQSRSELLTLNEELETRVRNGIRDLKDSRIMISAIADSAQDAIIMMDHEDKVSYWNNAAVKIFGYTAEEIMHKSVHLFLLQDKYKEGFLSAQKKFNGTYDGPVQGKTIELTARRKNGEKFPVELSLSVVKVKDIWSTIGVLRDITARKQAEKEKEMLWHQLLQSQKLESIGRLTGGIVHDFNNILTSIIGFSSIAYEQLPAGHPVKDIVEHIHDVGKKASSLIKQLLAFSRKQVLTIKACNINDILENMREILATILSKEIDLELDTISALKNICADESQIEQVFMNLAVNAKHAMPDGGRLTIKTRPVYVARGENKEIYPGEYVLISVKDSGVGMSSEVVGMIFEPFFTTRERGEGSGLGLSTVFGIIKQHDGFILVESEEGKGTTFKIYFPVTSAKLDKGVAKKQHTAEGGSETIMIVEDDTDILNMLANEVRSNGYNVIAAENGEEAITLCDKTKGKIDLLVTDVLMPVKNGWELYTDIIDKRPDIKVIFMSGIVDNSIVLNSIQKNEMPFMQKPLTPRALLNKMRSLLDGDTKIQPHC